ncbi:MAG: hypothetical protein WDO15_04200 [Bacteroidota bacterium]
MNFTLVNEAKRHKLDPYDPTRFKLLFIDHNNVDLYGLTLKAGRTYREDPKKDWGENNAVIVLNEAAIQQLGFKSAEEALHEHIWLNLWGSEDREIIGVVEDHYHESVKTAVAPTIYYPNNGAAQQSIFQ